MSIDGRDTIRHILAIHDGNGKRQIPLQETSHSIGRDITNSIVIDDSSVSRQHALLLRIMAKDTQQYNFRIVDGNLQGKPSTNGLFINGVRCSSHDLKHGDVIRFGMEAYAKYYAVSNLSEQEFIESCQAEDLSGFLLNRASNAETLVVASEDMPEVREARMAHLASFPELSPNPIIEIDIEGKITYLNPAALLKFPDIRKTAKEHPILASLTEIIVNQSEKAFIREVQVDGQFFEQSIHYFGESDLIRTFVVREITEQKKAQAELHYRDRLLHAVAESAHYLLTETNLAIAFKKVIATVGQAARVDRVYLFEMASLAVQQEISLNLCFEWANPPLPSSCLHWRNHPNYQDLSRWYDRLSRGEMLRGLTSEFLATEQPYLIQDQVESLLLVPMILDNEFWGCIGLADCQTERKWSSHEESTLLSIAASLNAAKQRQRGEERIRYQALHDMLTGLPNRLLFNEQLAKALPNAQRNGKSLAVIFLDLDRFKTINDTLGHSIGDRVLQQVAWRLQKCLRAGDTIARWGGDEFILLMPQVSHIDEVRQVAERIVQTLPEVFYLNGHELFITTSLGIALLDDKVKDAETLIQHADIALYYAKEQGRNNYQFYREEMNSNNPELLALEKSLHQALERQEFVVYYQPRINILTRQITGMEALLRWQHPEMGLIAPSIFIPLAEKNGLIIPIGEWVLRTACHQNRAWQEQGLTPLVVAVNLSPKQLQQSNLIEMVQETLSESQLDPRFLELEITETAAIHNLDSTKVVLDQLEKMGVLLAIDDFGTGYSSLSRLQNLPLHNLKIDQSFIRDITTESKKAYIVAAIIALGRGLGLKLTAEGVESQAELEFLQSNHCEDGQGYLFSHPVSAAEATEILREHFLKP